MHFSLSLFFAAAILTSLALNAAKPSIPFGSVQRQPQDWWFSAVEEAFRERCKAFASAHRSDEKR